MSNEAYLSRFYVSNNLTLPSVQIYYQLALMLRFREKADNIYEFKNFDKFVYIILRDLLLPALA